jgi:glycerophosphoryl diester phosphodiesterase
MMRWLRYALFVLALAFFGWTLVNASWLAPTPTGGVGLIAHRAPGGGIGTCATPPGAARYPVLPDNSLRAITDARQLGAAMIEIRIAPGGTVAPAACANSYGPRPTLAQVLQTARPKPLLFAFPAGADAAAADRLAADLTAIGHDPVAAGDAFYAAHENGAIARMRALQPNAWVFSAQSAAACRAAYRKTGWTGFLPAACKGGTMMIPLDGQGSLAGWPNRLLARMADAGGHVIMVAGTEGGGDPAGLTLPEQFGQIPDSFDGFIWTDDLWNLGPALFPRVDNRSRPEQDAGEAAVKARRARAN